MAKAKTKKEAIVEETIEAPMGDKVKVQEKPKPKTMKNLGKQDSDIKVDITKKEEKVEKPKDVQPEVKTDDKVVEEVQEKVEEKKVEEKETNKEDRKDERTRIQASQQSELIEQRNQNAPPKNFESKNNDSLTGDFDLGMFEPR